MVLQNPYEKKTRILPTRMLKKSPSGIIEILSEESVEKIPNEEPDATPTDSLRKDITISILNYKTSKWEVINDSFESTTNTLDYTKTTMENLPNLIKLKISVNYDNRFGNGVLLELPEFEVSGVAK
jgi:hypothetical protein